MLPFLSGSQRTTTTNEVLSLVLLEKGLEWRMLLRASLLQPSELRKTGFSTYRVLVKFDIAGIHSFIFVRTLKPEWFKCSAKDHGPTVMVSAVLAILPATLAGKDAGSIPLLAVLAVLVVAKNLEIVRSACQIWKWQFGRYPIHSLRFVNNRVKCGIVSPCLQNVPDHSAKGCSSLLESGVQSLQNGLSCFCSWIGGPGYPNPKPGCA